MSSTERELALIQVNKLLLEEIHRLLVEMERLKAQVEKKSGQNGQIANEPPGTVHCDHHCV